MDSRILNEAEYAQLHAMMLQEKFPHTPANISDAVMAYKEVLIYGLIKNEQLVAAFIFGNIQDKCAFFDVVCLKKFQGKWATKSVLRKLVYITFKQLNLDFIWIQTHGSKALKAALKGGFVLAEPHKITKTPTLILTKRQARLHFKFK